MYTYSWTSDPTPHLNYPGYKGARQCRGCSYGRPNSQGIASFADASQAAYRSSELSTNLLPLDSVTSRRKEKKGGLGLHGL
ncbi:unnamed protein product [Fusarium graminearum]|uniref:Chromosome 2, complete genome n=1 Tax=Gibberella zeae (strain ATCC MYA-4620 / CBS 123657 / FGSC 9075 / NRRL 31084 / PH-1) TaxID=229533 RepID=A0A0E0RZV2_GIBZE|nr:hypothetical protein FG05_30310 [Fusarium graminearum]CEF76777.1 unnamed protein product [Fusarium graminearum]CZS80068.1 unnamed protein product [Fusarium graminearum]